MSDTYRHILQIHREVVPGPVMDFLILGRAEAMRVAPEVPHIVISITTPDAADARLAESPHRLDVLRLQFHDSEDPAAGKENGVILIADEQAREIVEFVARHRENVRLIVCQCDLGMSRSAGVAAALSRWLQDEDEVFFRHYLPNRLVYNAVLRVAAAQPEVRE